MWGCPPPVSNNNSNNNNNNNGGMTSCGNAGEGIRGFAQDRVVGANDLFTVDYCLASGDSAFAFAQRVAGTSTTDRDTFEGDPVTIESGIDIGESVFLFDATGLPPAPYRLGITVTRSDQSIESFFSDALVQIVARPAPVITSPIQNQTIVTPNTLDISFNAGGIEEIVQWRLFLVLDGFVPTIPEGQGLRQVTGDIELATGMGNEGLVTAATGSIPTGVYRVILSSTDSGSSVVSTDNPALIGTAISTFTITLTDEPEKVTTVLVSRPSTTINVAPGQNVDVEFRITNPMEGQEVEAFSDDNRIESDGVDLFATSLTTDDTAVEFTAPSLPGGATSQTFNLGVRVVDELGLTVASSYGAGSVVISNELLEITSPDPAMTQRFRPGESVRVAWTTMNIPSTDEIEVVADDNDATTAPITILARRAATVTSATMTSEQTTPLSGTFVITVRVFFEDGRTLTDTTTVIFSTSPPIFWLGNLAKIRNDFDGAIFEGVNFADNAGSAFAGGEDFNSDGFGDFVIVARYAKPDFVNPDGVGAGEAYLIGGGQERYEGVYSLNGVGTEDLPGMAFRGLVPDSSPSPVPTDFLVPRTGATCNGPSFRHASDTFGLRSVFISPDVDGDGIGELLFGLPRVYSAGTHRLEADAQFYRGGIVAVSSQNSIVQNLSGSAIRLQNVGQGFMDTSVRPEIEDEDEIPSACDRGDGNNEGPWTADFRSEAENETRVYLCCDDGDLLDCIAAGIDECEANEDCPSGTCFAIPDPKEDDPETECLDAGFALSPCCVGSREFPMPGDNGETGQNPPPKDTLIEPSFGFTTDLAPPFSIDTCPDIFGTCEWEVDMDGPQDREGACRPNGRFIPGSGFYPETTVNDMGALVNNAPTEPYGARGLGFAQRDQFGTDVSVVFRSEFDQTGDLIVLAPGPAEGTGRRGGELLRNAQIWQTASSSIPLPRPHQYIINTQSHCGTPKPADEDDDPFDPYGGVPTSNTQIFTSSNFDRMQAAIGLPDFDGDGRDDIALGVPTRNSSSVLLTQASNGNIITVASTVGFEPGDLVAIVEVEEEGIVEAVDSMSNVITLESPLMQSFAEDVIVRTVTGTEVVTTLTSEAVAATTALVVADSSEFDVGDRVVIGGFAEPSRIDTIPSNTEITLIQDLENTFAIGSSLINPFRGDGAVYVVFRRDPALEGDFDLKNLELPVNDPERLRGLLIIGDVDQQENFGRSLAGNIDFNNDDTPDLVIGNPNADGGRGEIVIVFASETLVTEEGGNTVDELIADGDAVRIRGGIAGDLFGFNITNIGDFDGDGTNDLLVSAPMASPMFDANPDDDDFTLNTAGVDLNLDGIKDNVSGANKVADFIASTTMTSETEIGATTIEISSATGFTAGNQSTLTLDRGTADEEVVRLLSVSGTTLTVSALDRAHDSGATVALDRIDANDNLVRAGLCYVILGSNDANNFPAGGSISIDELGTGALKGVIFVGRHAGDLLGGGDVGDVNNGGICQKRGKGVSRNIGGAGDVDGDGRADLLIGSILADPRIDPNTGMGTVNAGEAYLIYGFRP
jgi:hypothetical protein